MCLKWWRVNLKKREQRIFQQGEHYMQRPRGVRRHITNSGKYKFSAYMWYRVSANKNRIWVSLKGRHCLDISGKLRVPEHVINSKVLSKNKNSWHLLRMDSALVTQRLSNLSQGHIVKWYSQYGNPVSLAIEAMICQVHSKHIAKGPKPEVYEESQP